MLVQLSIKPPLSVKYFIISCSKYLFNLFKPELASFLKKAKAYKNSVLWFSYFSVPLSVILLFPRTNTNSSFGDTVTLKVSPTAIAWLVVLSVIKILLKLNTTEGSPVNQEIIAENTLLKKPEKNSESRYSPLNL